MLKQFNLKECVFDDPLIIVDKNGNPILGAFPQENAGELQYTTNGDGWYGIDNQETIDGISESITGDGYVWEENGKIAYSGKRPSSDLKWSKKSKSWVRLSDSELSEQENNKIAQIKSALIQKLTIKTDQLKSQILAGYPQTEIDSFYRQEREAREWKLNSESPTPMLSAIAENRGVPFAILVEKVIEKADFLASQMGNLLGQKQAFEDRLNAADTIEKLNQLQQEIEQWML